MQLDQNPFFRKTITSWYDSNFVCWTLIVVLIFVFVFAITGVFVGSGNPNFLEYVWFPAFLAFLSLFLVIIIFLRVKRRSKNN
jgi:Na+/pantothenate symporter